jgi:zinc protease
MLDRTLAPPFQRSTVLSLLKATLIPLPNGMQLHVLRGGTQEVMRLELIAPAGKWYEPSVGLSHFTANQLDKGTKTKSSYQIASVFDAYGAHVEITPGNDFVTIIVYSLTNKIQEVLPLVAELLHEATFPEQELAIAKDITLQNLKVNEEKTSYLAGKYFRKALFGDHPYGSELEAANIENVQANGLRNYKKHRLQNFTLIASGNISDSAAHYLVDLFGTLPTDSSSKEPAHRVSVNPSQQYIEKAGSVQSTLRYGMRTISRQHADFFELQFATHILGGYFGSRLMKNIREEKGLTYGIFASLQPLRNDAFFVIGADVNRENRELTLNEIKIEMNRLGHEPVGADELTNARNHFIGSLQAEMTTAFAHADKYKTILLNRLPADYYQQMIDRVDAITAEDVMRTATQYFKAEDFTEVTVG